MSKTLLAALILALLAPAWSQTVPASPIVQYDIQARLVPESKTIQGRETLVWRNDSDQPVAELRFHLYMNAFKNNRSTFMTESRGSSRGFRADKENWGFIDVTEIGIKEGADLTPTIEFVQPDDRNADDQTVMKVTLPAPVKPGDSITLTAAFTVRLPKVFARAGFAGDFFMAGQWFPKIGVLWKGAWNCHQYHAQSEFFADYGTYRVDLTVPEKFVVGATGKRIGDKKNADATRTFTYAQDNIHDFAWTACPDFVESRERFHLAEPAVDTEMIFLVHKEHLGQRDRYVRALKQGLEFYSRSYGAYPYPTITLVDPAPGATGAGGMEYPTLFTAGTVAFMPAGLRMPEMVTIHEFGHGYWYGMVGSNEFEEAWLDEGINTYSEIKAMTLFYGPDRSLIDLGPIRIGDLAYQRLAVIGSGRFDPILKKSWDFVGGGSYAANVYAKAGLMLLTLERYLGEETMGRIMRTYFETWKFRHPTSEDFIQTAETVSGRDLKWFFDQALRSPDKLDYAVSSVSSEPVLEAEGMFKGKLVKADPAAAKTPAAYRSEVVVVRKGEWIFPQDILVVFANGRKIKETWDGRERWKRFVYTGPDRLDYAQVDPEGIWLLDVDRANNSLRLEPRPGGVRKAALKIAALFQHVLSLLTL
ncbi:MAG: M1 family metallopeptidase [Candidatus Aminicenantes bacterium]|nr:M1 family metallopeptidase [Candidatus Aminicenantes bacterium]